MTEAKRMLDLAARLAMRAAGDVEPGVMVGAVIVRDGRVIGAGHYRRFGGPHAEREAIADCRARGEDPRGGGGATMYVTLEPCNHHGKTPPCTDAIIEAGIARVVYARPDPNPAAAGGAEALRRAGVEAELSAESELATRLSDSFVKRVTTGLPWVIAKWAQTIDGRIATRTGESKWISGHGARARVHRLRARVDAIVTGLGTVMADDPMLTARGVRRVRRVAARVVVDPDLEIPLHTALVRTAREAPLLIACAAELVGAEITRGKREALEAAGAELLGVPSGPGGLDLKRMLALLAERRGAANVMIEAGAGLLGSMFAADLVDEAVVYIAPLLLGDEMARAIATGRVASSLASGMRFSLGRVRRVGDDVELNYRRR